MKMSSCDFRSSIHLVAVDSTEHQHSAQHDELRIAHHTPVPMVDFEVECAIMKFK